MRFKIFFTLAFIATVATVAFAIANLPLWLSVISAAVMAIAFALGYRAVKEPLKAIENGVYLIQSQDFSSRLAPTGQHDADRTIAMFNRMMDAMKAERLRNLEQNNFLLKLLEVSPTGIAICNFDGEIIESNPSFRAMASPELKKALSMLSEGESRTLRVASAEVVRLSRLWFMESGFRRPFFIVERLTDEIAHAEKEMFKKIIRTIGHEVNNTMGSIGSILETLEDVHHDDPDLKPTIESCRLSGSNLVDFVKGYADIIKLPAPDIAEIDLAAEIKRLLPSLRAMTPGNVTITMPEAEKPSVLKLDMMLIDRAIINIVKNSIESIADRPNGLISIQIDGNRLTITDNGRGIDQESSERLFTPFYSTKHPDRGLGLMLIAEILQSHKARFSLSTDEATALTTFSIEFRAD